MTQPPPTPHPTHIEAVADAAASGFKGDVVNQQQEEPCPDYARCEICGSIPSEDK